MIMTSEAPIGVNFPNRLGGGGGQRMKGAQGTIKILMKSDFFSDFTPFLAIIGGPGPPKKVGMPTVTPLRSPFDPGPQNRT